MNKFGVLLGAVILSSAFSAQPVFASEKSSIKDNTVQKEVLVELTKEQVTKKFIKLSGWSASVEATEQSPHKDFYQLIADGRIFYISKDGEHMFSGNLFDFGTAFVNRTEPRIRKSRIAMVVKSQDEYIEYKAQKERHVIYVFTDPSCSYCNKLHNNMQGYNDAGITVRYIPYPRNGKNFANGSRNPVFTDLNNAMCAGDIKSNINGLFNRQTLPKQQNCSDKTLTSFVALGKKLGVNSTPAIFTKSGMLLRGYSSPKELLVKLSG